MSEIHDIIEEAHSRGCQDLVYRTIACYLTAQARNTGMDGMDDATKAKVRDFEQDRERERGCSDEPRISTDAAAGYGRSTKA